MPEVGDKVEGLNLPSPLNETQSPQQPQVGARLSLFWENWAQHQVDPWVLQVLKEGYQIPFHHPPPLSPNPIDYPSYKGNKAKFLALQEEVFSMLSKKAIEVIETKTPGFYNRLFLVMKASGTWRPVLDVSRLNKFVTKTKFSMETTQSVLQSIQKGDWMVSMDMKDAYFHIPIHPESRKYLRFTFDSKVYQFRALCFGLSTAPQVFTRVLAPLAKIIHLAGFKIVLYLDDWLVIGRTREEVLRAREFVLKLTLELGIIINKEKSCLVPSQIIEYLGLVIDTHRFWVSPTKKRVESARLILTEFLGSDEQQARSWQSLLGHLSSLEKLVPGARLRMRPLQFFLNKTWNRISQQTWIPIPQDLKSELIWWAEQGRIEQGLSLQKKNPSHKLFSDASREGWGATIGGHHLSGKWSPSEKKLHINILELKAIWLALQEVLPIVKGQTIAVFLDNTTALSYIRKQGGTKSWSLFRLVQEMILWLEKNNVNLLPQFIQGSRNSVADALSRKGQILATEWILHQDVCLMLWKMWGRPMVDLFATSLTKRLPLYMAPHSDPMAIATDAMLQSWSNLDAYAFPPFAMIRQVLNKFKESTNCKLILIAPWWPQREWFPDLQELAVEAPKLLPLRPDLLAQPLIRARHPNLRMLRLAAWRDS